MELQYQSSNGKWHNCEERSERFLMLCEQNNHINEKPMTREEVISALTAGQVLRNDDCDWYSKCRDMDFFVQKEIERKKAYYVSKDYPIGRELDCGCKVFLKSEVMSASLGTSCADCYDDMSS